MGVWVRGERSVEEYRKRRGGREAVISAKGGKAMMDVYRKRGESSREDGIETIKKGRDAFRAVMSGRTRMVRAGGDAGWLGATAWRRMEAHGGAQIRSLFSLEPPTTTVVVEGAGVVTRTGCSQPAAAA